MRRARVLLLAAFATAPAGCATGGESVNPVPATAIVTDAGDGADAPATSNSEPQPPAPPDAGPAKREVLARNPFGGPAGNLLADGDFEFSTLRSSGSQVGFRSFDSSGASHTTLTETGGLCRSGLRCAVFEATTSLYLRGVAANGKPNVASIWAKLPVGKACRVIVPVLVTCDDGVINKKLNPSSAPDDTGWCHYSAVVPEKTSALCLHVTSGLKAPETALVDSAVLAPDDGTIPAKAAEMWIPSGEFMAGLGAVQQTIRRTMPFSGGGRGGERDLR